jgi:hypothetical protein
MDTEGFFASIADAPRLNPASLPAITLPLAQIFETPPERIVVPTRTGEPWKFRRGRRIDFAERDARNRHMARLGEEFVVGVERQRLSQAGRDDLAGRVEWVSQTQGDGLGYDVLSFDAGTAAEKLIEVKTTGAPKYTTFYVSRNEVRCSEAMADRYSLYRVFSFSTLARLYELQGSLRRTCDLEPIVFEAALAVPQSR